MSLYANVPPTCGATCAQPYVNVPTTCGATCAQPYVNVPTCARRGSGCSSTGQYDDADRASLSSQYYVNILDESSASSTQSHLCAAAASLEYYVNMPSGLGEPDTSGYGILSSEYYVNMPRPESGSSSGEQSHCDASDSRLSSQFRYADDEDTYTVGRCHSSYRGTPSDWLGVVIPPPSKKPTSRRTPPATPVVAIRPYVDMNARTTPLHHPTPHYVNLVERPDLPRTSDSPLHFEEGIPEGYQCWAADPSREVMGLLCCADDGGEAYLEPVALPGGHPYVHLRAASRSSLHDSSADSVCSSDTNPSVTSESSLQSDSPKLPSRRRLTVREKIYLKWACFLKRVSDPRKNSPQMHRKTKIN